MSADTSSMTLLYFILTLLAVIAFAVAAFVSRPNNRSPQPGALFFIALGLALFAFVPLLQLGQRL